MTSSPGFVGEPEASSVAERLIRALKDNLLRVRHFVTVTELVEDLVQAQVQGAVTVRAPRLPGAAPGEGRPADLVAESRDYHPGQKCRRVGWGAGRETLPARAATLQTGIATARRIAEVCARAGLDVMIVRPEPVFA